MFLDSGAAMRHVIEETGQTTPSFVVTQNERIARLHALDLTNVKRKLKEPEPEGKGWSQEQVDEAETWYRRFLYLMIVGPKNMPVVPNGPIDIFWHQHILDTRAYAKDCEHIFGEFIHHYPYFGMNGDEAELDDSFDATNALYREHFGEDCRKMVHFTLKRAMKCSPSGCKESAPVSCRREDAIPEKIEPELVGANLGAESCRRCGSCKKGQ